MTEGLRRGPESLAMFPRIEFGNTGLCSSSIRSEIRGRLLLERATNFHPPEVPPIIPSRFMSELRADMHLAGIYAAGL